MHLAQTLNEILKHVAELEANLAEADALIASHSYRIDQRAKEDWPKDSAIRKAVNRHVIREVERLKAEYECSQRAMRGL